MNSFLGRRFLFFLTFPLVLAAWIASPASAGQPRTHDGLLLRLSAGGGFANSSMNDIYFPEVDMVADLKLSGMSGDLNFAIGAVVSPNLAIHGTLWGWSVTDADFEILDQEFNTDVSMTMSALGGGVTYYFMPANLYLSGSVGPAWLSWEFEGEDSDSDTGFALDITLGKEWWVGGSWGLGVAGCFGYHSIPDGDIDENWSGASFGLRFSATLN